MSERTLKKSFSVNDVNSKAIYLTQVIIRAWQHWQFNIKTRRQLAKLTCLELRDVGISSHDAMVEIQKPFWQ